MSQPTVVDLIKALQQSFAEHAVSLNTVITRREILVFLAERCHQLALFPVVPGTAPEHAEAIVNDIAAARSLALRELDLTSQFLLRCVQLYKRMQRVIGDCVVRSKDANITVDRTAIATVLANAHAVEAQRQHVYATWFARCTRSIALLDVMVFGIERTL